MVYSTDRRHVQFPTANFWKMDVGFLTWNEACRHIISSPMVDPYKNKGMGRIEKILMGTCLFINIGPFCFELLWIMSCNHMLWFGTLCNGHWNGLADLQEQRSFYLFCHFLGHSCPDHSMIYLYLCFLKQLDDFRKSSFVVLFLISKMTMESENLKKLQ